jgi:hypothetical protein
VSAITALCENFKKSCGFTKPSKNKPVAIAKLNKPIKASAAERWSKPVGLM